MSDFFFSCCKTHWDAQTLLVVSMLVWWAMHRLPGLLLAQEMAHPISSFLRLGECTQCPVYLLPLFSPIKTLWKLRAEARLAARYLGIPGYVALSQTCWITCPSIRLEVWVSIV